MSLLSFSTQFKSFSSEELAPPNVRLGVLAVPINGLVAVLDDLGVEPQMRVGCGAVAEQLGVENRIVRIDLEARGVGRDGLVPPPRLKGVVPATLHALELAHLFDERNDAVKALLKMAIDACKKHGKYIGICGQGPSDHPDFAQWLMEQGIDSVSLNPDSVLETWLFLAEKLKT